MLRRFLYLILLDQRSNTQHRLHHFQCRHPKDSEAHRRRARSTAHTPARGPPLWDKCAAQESQKWGERVHAEPDWDLANPSPQQITGHMAKLHLHESASRVSHETIYNVIYAQPRGELRCDLIACMRMARAKRWPRSRGEDRRGQIADLLSIHLRPPEIEDRQFPWHWEGDLIKGAANASAIGSLVERSTRLLILVKLPHPHPATAAHVLQAFTDKLISIAQPMRKTLTYDRGREMAHHAQLTANTAWRCTFVIRTAPGSAGPMRTPMDWCVSTCPRGRISQATARSSWMRLPMR